VDGYMDEDDDEKEDGVRPIDKYEGPLEYGSEE
jgi:hypothetical protein